MEKKNNAITSIYEQGSVLEKNDMNYDKNQMILMILILSVILKKGIEDNKRWDDFSKSIKTESHFFPKGELLERIEQIAIYATDTIKKGTIIYRAREYGQDDFSKNEEIVSLSGMIEERYPNLDSMNDVELANIIQEMILSFYGEKKIRD